MYLLDDIVTCDTPVIKLHDVVGLPDDVKAGILCDGTRYKDLLKREKEYLSMIKTDGKGFYYFKSQDSMNFLHYAAFNELIGSYLADVLKIDSVKYSVASCDDENGLASIDFKNRKKYIYKYASDVLDEALLYTTSHLNFECLRNLCISKENEDRLFEALFKIIAIDLFMYQYDRNGHNMQFMIDKKTSEISLAPFYDYSYCLNARDKFKYVNPIVCLNTIEDFKSLIKKFRGISDYLDVLFQLHSGDIVEDIFDEYSFNKDGYEFDDILEEYNFKFDNQKQLLKRNSF